MSRHPVFVRNGDALPEIASILGELGTAEEAGLHKQMYVTRADQTVVLTTHAEAPLARVLRQRPGWTEPRE